MADHHGIPLRIGLTGGIAGGKSAVADAFSRLGVNVLSADAIAHELTAPGSPLLDDIRARFGQRVFQDDGTLDRAALRRVVFEDEAARHELERLMHPLIRERLHENAFTAGGEYLIMEVPLLRASDVGTLVDRVLVVDVDEAEQLRRLTSRDGIDVDTARRMLDAQPSREDRLAIADDMLDNSGAESDIPDKVEGLHALYLEIARRGDPRRPGLR